MSNSGELKKAIDEVLDELGFVGTAEKKALVSSIKDAIEELGLLDEDDDDEDERFVAGMVFDVVCAWKNSRGLRPAKVPSGLRELVPLAERWGIRNGLARAVRRLTSTPDETRELMTALDSHQEEIDEWLDGLDPFVAPDAEKAAFLYMSKANAEI